MTPRSLYIQQLEDRLGLSAVENVVLPEQQSTDIFDLLAAWGGHGDFSDGGFTGDVPAVSFIDPEGTIDVSTWEGGDIQVEASDDDGTIQHVKLLINGEPIAMDSEAPYTFTDLTTIIQNLSHETHFLQAIATDNDGNTTIARVAILGGDPPPPNEDEEEQENLEIRAYPNPVQTGELTIEMVKTGSYTARIFDSYGREVDRFMFTEMEYKHIFEKNMAKGIYILEVKEAEEILFKSKFLVQ